MSNTGTMFSGLRDAKVSEKGVWLKEGSYVVRVKRGLLKNTRSKGDAFILEFTIEKSNYLAMKKQYIETLGAAPFDMAELEKLLPNQEGTSANWYQSLKDKDIGYGAVKGFAASILGMKPEDPAFIEGVEAFVTSICNQGSINGRLIPIETVLTKTQKNTDFTRYNFGVMLAPDAASAAAAAAIAAAPPPAVAPAPPAAFAPPPAAFAPPPPPAPPALIHGVPLDVARFLRMHPGTNPAALTPEQAVQWHNYFNSTPG